MLYSSRSKKIFFFFFGMNWEGEEGMKGKTALLIIELSISILKYFQF